MYNTSVSIIVTIIFNNLIIDKHLLSFILLQFIICTMLNIAGLVVNIIK